MSAFMDDDIILSAVMPKKGHFIPNWKVRFVVLSTDRLQYFEDPSKQVKKGDLLITDETEVEGRVGSNHEFKFTIKTGSKSLTMAAASSEMREEWTQAVRKLVGLKLSAASIKEISAIAPSSSTSKQAGMQQTLRRRKVPFAGETEGRGAPGSPQPSMDAEMNGRTRSVSQPTAAHREAADEGQTLHRPASVAVSRQAPATAEAEGMVGEDNGWEKVDSPEGTYYYHKKTRVSRWDKPDDAVTALNSRLQDTERSADSAFQMRKEQMELEKIAAAEKAQLLEQLKPEVLKLLASWKEPSPGNPNDLISLINSLPSILPHLHEEVSLGRFSPYLRSDATENDIKKAYFRAIRFLHPDKLPVSLELCDKMVAEYCFAHLCEVYQLYREMIAV